MPKIVSIIMPCYNGERYIHRMLQSICEQTYKDLELILINDGSIDKTEDTIFSFKPEFDRLGYKLVYIKQENKGQSAAINEGLKVFTGDYISFVDSDDILSKDAIEKKVEHMEAHPHIGLSICRIKVLDFDSLKPIGVMQRNRPIRKDNIAFDLISGKNVFYTPGGFFWRSSMFKDVMSSPIQIAAPREIGQNFQLIIPISYKYPVDYIDDYLYFYLVRKGSHSRKAHTLEEALHIWDVAKEVLKSIAYDIESNQEKLSRLLNLINIRYYYETMNLMLKYKEKQRYKEFKQKWLTLKSENRKGKKMFLSLSYHFFQQVAVLRKHAATLWR